MCQIYWYAEGKVALGVAAVAASLRSGWYIIIDWCFKPTSES